MKTELRRWLEDELSRLGERLPPLEERARSFWRDPGTPELSVWAQPAVAQPIPEPADGTVTERHLYQHIHTIVRPALESRSYGFDTVPVVYVHTRHYTGAPFGTRFGAVVMGGKVTFPDSLPPERRTGWFASVEPVVKGAGDIDRLLEVDVAQSPAVQAIVRACEEIGEIVRGRLIVVPYSSVQPLDMAADLMGHVRFYELIATEPETALRLLQVCSRKWHDVVRLQERIIGERTGYYQFEPGLRIADMILKYLSPASIREVVLPCTKEFASDAAEVFVDLDHPDPSLLGDYLGLPGVYAFGVRDNWKPEMVIDAFADHIILRLNFDWHYHPGQAPDTTVRHPWDTYRRRLSAYARRLRVHVHVSGWGDTPTERVNDLRRDLEDLRHAWDIGGATDPV